MNQEKQTQDSENAEAMTTCSVQSSLNRFGILQKAKIEKANKEKEQSQDEEKNKEEEINKNIEKIWLKNRLDIMGEEIQGREMIQRMQAWQRNESK